MTYKKTTCERGHRLSEDLTYCPTCEGEQMAKESIKSIREQEQIEKLSRKLARDKTRIDQQSHEAWAKENGRVQLNKDQSLPTTSLPSHSVSFYGACYSCGATIEEGIEGLVETYMEQAQQAMLQANFRKIKREGK